MYNIPRLESILKEMDFKKEINTMVEMISEIKSSDIDINNFIIQAAIANFLKTFMVTLENIANSCVMSEEEYKELIKIPAAQRFEPCSVDKIDNAINGILVTYANRIKMRNGHVDIITMRDAEKDIKELLKMVESK